MTVDVVSWQFKCRLLTINWILAQIDRNWDVWSSLTKWTFAGNVFGFFLIMRGPLDAVSLTLNVFFFLRFSVAGDGRLRPEKGDPRAYVQTAWGATEGFLCARDGCESTNHQPTRRLHGRPQLREFEEQRDSGCWRYDEVSQPVIAFSYLKFMFDMERPLISFGEFLLSPHGHLETSSLARSPATRAAGTSSAHPRRLTTAKHAWKKC